LLNCLGRLAHLLAPSGVISVVDATPARDSVASVALDPRVMTLRDAAHRDRLLSLAQHAALTFAPPGLAAELLRHAAASTTVDSEIVVGGRQRDAQAAFVRQQDEIKFEADDHGDELGFGSARGVGPRTQDDAHDSEPCQSLWLRALVLYSREAALRLAALPPATVPSPAPTSLMSATVAASVGVSVPAVAAPAPASSTWSLSTDWVPCPLGCVLADGRVLAAPRLELPLSDWSEHRSQDRPLDLRLPVEPHRPTSQPRPEPDDADRHVVNKRRRRSHLPGDSVIASLTGMPAAAAPGARAGDSSADGQLQGTHPERNVDSQTFSHLQASIELF
jgi:hypothetical protein